MLQKKRNKKAATKERQQQKEESESDSQDEEMSEEEVAAKYRSSTQPPSKAPNQGALIGKRKTQGSAGHAKEMPAKRLKAEDNSKSSKNEDTESEYANNSESDGLDM